MNKGRPSSYKPEYVEQARALAENGATTFDIAEFFGVSVQTIHNWMAKHTDFVEAIEVAKKIADSRVERSLYERAIGYSYNAEKIMSYEGEIIRAPYVHHVPPEISAQIIWLRNRQPDKWRQQPTSDEGETTITITGGLPD